MRWDTGSESGYQLPIVFAIAVIPMYFVALACRHLTDAAPAAGTVFTWGSKAITPHVGWMGGFALMLSSILAGVGAAGILTNPAEGSEPDACVKTAGPEGFSICDLHPSPAKPGHSTRSSVIRNVGSGKSTTTVATGVAADESLGQWIPL